MGRNLLTFMFIGILALAGTAMAVSTPGEGAGNLTDRQFLQDALNISAFQETMGEIAVRQAAGKDFKEYGRDMAETHSRIRRGLEELAARRGLKLSASIDPVRQNTMRVLSQEYGAAFDRSYISLMIDENRRAAVLYRQMAESAADRDLREFASRTGPELEEYVRRAEKILSDLPFPFLK